MNKLSLIAALFNCDWNVDSNKLSFNDSYHIWDLKVSGIRYSRRMFLIRSAISIYLLIRESLFKKIHIVVLHDEFNYAIPSPDT